MAAGGFRGLMVWQRSMDAAEMVHSLTRKFPKDELYGMVSQLRRASSSVPMNIAEGYKRRRYKKDYVKFLVMAHGSEAEMETALELCIRFKYVDEEQGNKLIAEYDEIGRMLSSLIDKIDGA
jgi:four helix bundle protein